MRTIARGWCPKHDRIYPRTDRCPDCGTVLVRLEPPFHEEPARAEITPDELEQGGVPPPSPPPVARPVRRFPRRLAIAAALLAAFGLGSIVPGDGTTPQGSGDRVLREIHLRDQIGRAPGGATIFLGSVVQTSRAFVATFSPGPGAPEPRLIEDAAVEVTTGRGRGERTFSVPELAIAQTHEGFRITGLLDTSAPITEIRITSIQVRDEAAPEWSLNLSKVWPVGADEPRVLYGDEQPRPVEGGTIRLASLVCWRDRIEAVFELRGDDGTPGNRSEMAGLELLVSTPNAFGTLVGHALAATKTELTSAGQMIARFESVPDDAGPIVIRATRMLSFAGGPWVWRLP